MAKSSKKRGATKAQPGNEKVKPKEPSKNNVVLKVALPIGIVAVVLGLFFFKNAGGESAAAAQTPVSTTQSEPGNSSFGVESQEERTVIPLNISAVDLDEVLSHNLPVIIDFGADSCIPCKEMAPVLKRLNEELQDVAVIHFVDVWKNADAAADFPVRVIPTQVFILPDGSPYVPSEGLTEELGIEFSMYTHKDTGEHIFTTHEGGLTEEQMRAILADMGASL